MADDDDRVIRACCVRYGIATKGPEAGLAAIAYERGRGFLWVGQMSDLLADYETNRERYPAFESFAPRIVEFFDEYAESGEYKVTEGSVIGRIRNWFR